MVKPSLEKQPRFKQGATNKTLTSLEKIPAEMISIAVRVQGIQWLNWLVRFVER
ncbi:hypothetical protein PQG02_36695 (plasmid) [Nostoc sp. UHCC 0926]|uniref:hypothetical protein n=1 Tax=Nostoc sp. UHCC 0926 TaxID=3025190 RepID=UPI00235E2F66|nr:hypothetical protein [Nostoc sp. UHCC 0926]WDD36650.1 hypothetical protein PQG02_36695 [Nostoc sp. UHCC 0926]